jgi:hypothetical protein
MTFKLRYANHRYEFNDRYQTECTLQNSSLASEDAIWLGVHSPKDAANGRMHLTKEMVRELIPRLQEFVDTGYIQMLDDLADIDQSKSEAMFGPPEEHLQATNGLLCPVCERPQFTTYGGAVCENGHGGCEGVPRPITPRRMPAPAAMRDLLTCVEVRWPEESPLVQKAMAADMHWVAQQISDDPPTAKQYLGHEVWNVVFLDLCSIAETHWHVSGPLMKGMACAMLQAALQKGQMP